jgi:hypothetical protein
MKISRKLILVIAGFSLSACSSTGEKNSFMSFSELQDKVREHDAQWETAQVKLDRIDELEAEVSALKQGDMAGNTDAMMGTSNDMVSDSSMAVINVAPVVTADPIFSEDDVSTVEIAPLASMPAKIKPLEFGVQVASYRNHDEAIRGWNVLLKADPTSYEGLDPLINQKQVNGQTMYQLKVGPFVNKRYGMDFCQMLKGKGKDCLVTQYNGDTFTVN